MTALYVCPLSRIDEIATASNARSLVTLINVGTPVARPACIAADRHLFISMSDVTTPMQGHIAPAQDHVAALLDFVRAWDRAHPVLIHCWAGVSRSTAAAFVAACALAPQRDEAEIAEAIRAASPTATPNARFVAVADDMLRRDGRMNAAVAAIGRGVDCFEGVPFSLAV
ncbi:MAG: dual specificity protein phosphatase family protein [Hyphomicrobiales bacterium]|nr:dual specificity protein phosphatase family protein [Hyphomicrobiales bacterium]